MKLLIFICLTLALAASAEEITSENFPDVYDYHRRTGIPRAMELMKIDAEESIESSRIVGGNVVDISQVPYQVGLVITVNWFWTSVCGASVISNNRLLTAAHCQHDGVNTATSMTAAIGTNTVFSGGQRITTRDVVMHPNWNFNNAANDIAVMRLPTSIVYNNVAQPINLPDGHVGNAFIGWTALASGFGITSDGGSISTSQRVSAVNLPVISNAECAAVYGAWVHNTNICTSGAGGRGTCGGDSGGPLVVTVNGVRILIGVTSYGSRAGCAVGHPAAFARVTEYIPWIRSI